MADSRRVRLAFAVYNQPVAESVAWRIPGAARAWTTDPVFLRRIVETAERGLFDYFFIPSILSSPNRHDLDGNNDPFRLDSLQLAAHAAAYTSRIGLAVTVNTSYEHPYDVARATAGLDHLSGGRAAVNVVTGAPGSEAAHNYGLDAHPATAEKYERADEFMDVLLALWNSWPERWWDSSGGRLILEGAGEPIDHRGRYFQVRGPLPVSRPPQGRLPIIHAGVSERSAEFGARWADIRFASFADAESARSFYADTKRRVAESGREPDEHHIVPGLTFYVDETTTGARSIYRQVQALSRRDVPSLRTAVRLGIDLDRVRGHESALAVLADEVLADPRGLYARARAAFGGDDLTISDLAHFESTEAKGQPALVGSAVDIADWIEERFTERALDGVKVYPPYLPAPLDAFVDLVVPELQRRGLAQRDYATTTFREHFSLPALSRAA